MDALDALLRLHHAAGSSRWLREALRPTAPDLGPAEVRAPIAPEALLAAPVPDWLALGAPIGAREAALDAEADAVVARTRRWLAEDEAHQVLAWNDAAYPEPLRSVAEPPTLLFAAGGWERLWWPQVAVVGSRAPTPAGRERAAAWARSFVEAGFVVTSGLAAGIDAAAHAAALASAPSGAGGVGPGTIAVMATGPDRCFPAAHRGLKAAIAAGGCVITEHPPGTEARPGYFPARNRIIAGLALATVVVEAAHRSGALITARLAAEAGREVFALPGAPENLKARGCHRLIRDGATLVDDPQQVIEALVGGLRAGTSRPTAIVAAPEARADGLQWPAEHRRIGQALGPDGASLDALIARTGLTSATLAPILLDMELEGRLTQQHGVYLPCR